MSTVDRCTCPWVDPRHWTTHYGAVEPGSTREFDPTCPEHGYAVDRSNEIASSRYATANPDRVCVHTNPYMLGGEGRWQVRRGWNVLARVDTYAEAIDTAQRLARSEST